MPHNKTYDKYKDSGFEWLPKIPNDWKLERLHDVSDIRTSNVNKKTVDGQEAVQLCNYVDVYYNDKITSDIEFMVASASENEIDRFTLKAGDVVITKDSESPYDIGVPALIHEDIEDLVCGYHLAVIRPYEEVLHGPFLFYALSGTLSAYQFTIASNGVTRFGLSTNGTKNVTISIPSLDEQKTIAGFLDHKTVMIDELIQKKKSLIEKLDKQRTGLITKAVTKGLDDSVPMKDSGVDWLGQVPEHWDVVKLRFLLSENLTNGIFKKAEFWGTGYRIVNVFDLYVHNDIVCEASLDRVQCSEDELGKYSAKHGDFFFVRSSLKLEGVGKSAAVMQPDEQMVFECHLVRGRPDLTQVHPRYLSLFLNSKFSREYLVSCANVVTMATIDQSKFNNLPICLPPIEEQIHLVKTIDQCLAKIDVMVTTTTDAIKSLEEYRMAIITAAVTGKVRVG